MTALVRQSKKITSTVARVGLALMFTASLFVSDAEAVAVSWNVGGSGNWDTTTANWTGGSTMYTDGDDVTFSDTTGGTITLTANRAPLSTTVSATSGTFIFLGSNITSGGLAKSGGGALTLNSAVTAGTIVFSSGTLTLGAAERLPDSEQLNLNGGGSFDMAGFSETVGNFTGGANIVNFGGITTTIAGGDRNSGSISGPGALTKNGPGGFTYRRGGSPNTYTGGTFLNNGTTSLYNIADVLPGTGPLTVSAPGTLNLGLYNNGYQQTIGALLGNGNIKTSSTNLGGTPFRIGNGGDSGTYSGIYSGNGSLTKLGAGTQTLDGNNTYTGTTTVADGTLIVNGITGAGQDNYIVQSGATLGGSGIINLAGGKSLTIDDGGTLAPGNSFGTLTIAGDVIFNDNSLLNFELSESGVVGGLNNDLLIVNGNLTLDGILTTSAMDIGSYPFITYTGTLTNNGLEFAGGGNYLLDFSVANQISLVVVPVPEPSTFLLLGLGAIGLTVRRRNKRNRR